VIGQKWLTDKKGGHFTFATSNTTTESVFIHQNSFSREVNFADFSEGQSISFELQERDGKYSGWKVAGPTYKDEVRLKKL
jgi:cold shock CspA family protein